MTIGGEKAGTIFGRIVGITAVPGGGVAVLDGGESVVKVFGQDGEYLRDIGRAGAGPGEFRAPRAIGAHDSVIWTWDLALARITTFGLDGQLLQTYPVPLPGRGVLLTDQTIGIFTSRSYGSTLRRADTLAVYKTTTQNAKAVRILAQHAPYRILKVPMGNGRQMVGRQPFDEPTLVVPALDGTGFAVIDLTGGAASARVERYDMSGKRLFRRIVTRRSAIPLSRKEVESAVSYLAQGEADNEAFREAIRSALYLPKTLPTVTGALCARDGSVWVRHETERASTGPQAWTIVNAAGTRDLQLPRGFVPFDASERWVWGVNVDADDNPIVQKLELRQ